MRPIVLAIFCMISVTFSLQAEENNVPPETIEGAYTIDAAEAQSLLGDAILFVDVRNMKDYQAGHIPGAVHLELKKALSKKELLSKANIKDAIVFYCNDDDSLSSSEATELAIQWGFKQVKYFRGGYSEWKEAGYPTQ